MRVKQMLMMIATVLIMAAVMGCASSSTQAGTASQSGDSRTNATVGTAQQGPVLGKNGVPMPDWAMGRVPPETGDSMYFVTQGGKTGTSTNKTWSAQSNAMAELAIYVNSKTDALIKNYSERAGELENTQSLESLKTGIIARASSNTSGIRRIEQWEAADGEYYGLFAYDKVVFKGDIRAEVDSFRRNSSAAAANFEAGKFFEEMERDI